MQELKCMDERELTDAELEAVTGGLHSHSRLYIEGDEDLSVTTTPILVATLPATPVTAPVTIS